MADKIVIGFLIVTILLTSIYVAMDNVKLRVDNDKSTFYVKEDSYWKVSGREYNKLFDGSSRMNRRSSLIDVTSVTEGTQFTITRYTPYIRGPKIVDTYEFDGSLSDVEMFPISHTVEIFNGSGYIYQYEVRDLVYDGVTIKNVESPQKFGRQMEVEWDTSESYWNTVYKSGILKVRYRIRSDYESFEVRLFDPPVQDWNYLYSNKTISEKQYYWVNETRQTPVYREVTDYPCCPEMNGSCYSPCDENLSCSPSICYEREHEVFDHWDYYNVSVEKWRWVDKQVPDVRRKALRGINVSGDIYTSNKVNVWGQTACFWNVDWGWRNLEEYPCCRDFEVEKGACYMIDLKDL